MRDTPDYQRMNDFFKRHYTRVEIQFYISEEDTLINIQYHENDIEYEENILETGKQKYFSTDYNGNIIEEETITDPFDRLLKYTGLPDLKDFSEGDEILLLTKPNPIRYKVSISNAHEMSSEFKLGISCDFVPILKWEPQSSIYEPPNKEKEEITIIPDYTIFNRPDPILEAIEKNISKSNIHITVPINLKPKEKKDVKEKN